MENGGVVPFARPNRLVFAISKYVHQYCVIIHLHFLKILQCVFITAAHIIHATIQKIILGNSQIISEPFCVLYEPNLY